MDVTVTDAPDQKRYEARVDGELAAFVDYIPTGGRFGQIIAKAMGRDPSAEIRQGLLDFKRFMETGETPTTEGQSQGA